jgi:hypothetical protein
MLDDDQRMMSLFEDSHKLERGKTFSDLQFREPAMQTTENTRKVAGDIGNLVSLQVQVAVDHGYDVFSPGR